MHKRHVSFACLFAIILGAAGAARAQSQRVFFTDFGNRDPFSGFRVFADTEGLQGLGPPGNQFSGQVLHNNSGQYTAHPTPAPTRLTLHNLPAHQSIDLNFLLAILNTWDAPEDVFTVAVDGRTVFREHFTFYQEDQPVYAPPPGGLLTPRTGTGAGMFPDRGFDNSWGDQAYNMYLEPRLKNIGHTGSTLVVDLFTQPGFLGGENESFALDNFEVRVNIPEPGALGFLVLGGILLRRRRM